MTKDTRRRFVIPAFIAISTLSACEQPNNLPTNQLPIPRQTIDLGALVTEDLPERVWGKALLSAAGFEEHNSFRVVAWEQELGGRLVAGSNSYFTLFNHGGPHVDAPSHVGLGEGIDGFAVEAYSGRLKVFDVSQFAAGGSVDIEVFRSRVGPGDIVLIYTAYSPPASDDAFPEVITLTVGAAEYLAKLPARAFATDAQSADSAQDDPERKPSVHDSFLGRGIPIYEQLFHVDELLGKENMYFVGVPLNIENGDGMMVRPVVLVY